MNAITLFFHVLFAAALIGYILPEILIKRIYRAASLDGKLALARLHLLLMVWGLPILIAIILTGVGRTFELGYPWFSFGVTFWLAAKQTLGLFLLVWYLIVYSSILNARRFLSTESEKTDSRLAAYRRVRGRIHPVVMTTWLLALLGVLKI